MQYPPCWLLCIWGEQSRWGGGATGRGRGECQVGTAGVGHIAHTEVVHQLPAQVFLLLTLTLQGLQSLLQLGVWDVLQTQRVLQLAIEKLCLLLQDLDLMFQAFILHLNHIPGGMQING